MSDEKLIPQKLVLEVLCSIQGALGEDNQKVFAKSSMMQGKEWGKTIPLASTPESLMEKIAKYFQEELQIAKSVTFEKRDQDYILSFRGCYICHGKLVKERFGIMPAYAV